MNALVKIVTSTKVYGHDFILNLSVLNGVFV